MAKKRNRKKSLMLVVLALVMLQIAFYILPFGYDVGFYWLQQNVFGGNYWYTDLFMYAFAAGLTLCAVAIMFYVGITKKKVVGSVRSMAR